MPKPTANAVMVCGSDIWVAGGGSKDLALAEYNYAGTLVSTFAYDGWSLTAVNGHDAAANAMAVLGNGDILVAGYGYNTSGNQAALLAEFTSSGALVPSFGTGGIMLTSSNSSAAWNALAVSGSYTFVAGYGDGSSENQDIMLAEFSGANPVSSFGSSGYVMTNIGGTAAANAMTIETNGEILVAGYGSTQYINNSGGVNTVQQVALVQYETDGVPDATFGAGGVAMQMTADTAATANGVAILSGGNVAVAGQIAINYSSVLVSEFTTSTTPASTYTYDVRNEMVSATVSGVTATYLYDDAGNRVQETTNGTTSFYLTDTANPTGYAQPLEAWASTSDNRSTATLEETYILGDRVLGQANAGGTLGYLLADGQGDTRLITSATGTVTAALSYDAGGDVTSSSGSASTIFEYPDGPVDPVSGLRMPGDGTREEEIAEGEFIERDFGKEGMGDTSDPITLNAEIYGDDDPENNDDPTGHYSLADIAVTAAIYGSLEAGDLGTAAEGAEEGAGEADAFSEYNNALEDLEDEVDDQLAGNRASGRAFQDSALENMDPPLAENTQSYTVNVGNRQVTTIPDSYQPGVQMTEVKNVAYQYNSSQLQAQMQLAEQTNTPYTLVIRSTTRLSQTLIDALRDAGARVLEYDPGSGIFTPRAI